MEVASKLIEAFGYPIAVSIVLAMAIARVARWLAPRADRVVDAHVSTLAGMAESAKQTAESTRQAANTQNDIKDLIVSMDRGKAIDEIHEAVLSGKFVCKKPEEQKSG